MERIISICPRCEKILNAGYILSRDDYVAWIQDGNIPIVCPSCRAFYVQDVDALRQDTEHNVGDFIRVHANKHMLDGQRGRVIQKEGHQYRIEFKSGIRMWFSGKHLEESDVEKT